MEKLYLQDFITVLKTKEESTKLWANKYLENCKIFFIEPEETNEHSPQEEIYVEDLNHITELDLPFETCWFQHTFNVPLVVNVLKFEDEGYNGELHQLIRGILVIEEAPLNYIYVPYTELCPKDNYDVVLSRDILLIKEDKSILDLDLNEVNNSVKKINYINTLKTCSSTINKILGDLKNTNNTIFVNENHSFKLKKNGKKYIHKIKEVIYITSNVKKISSINKNNIVQKCGHRFDVRGHWRQTNGIGKNRQGEYIVENFTWVKPCVKGDSTLPYIGKSRIVTKTD